MTDGVAAVCNCMFCLGYYRLNFAFLGVRDLVSVPSKWNLYSLISSSNVHECDRRQTTDHAMEKTVQQ